MQRWFSRSLSLIVATSVATPSPALAAVVMSSNAPSSSAEEKAFTTLRDEAERAAEEEDWDVFLENSVKALDALPERESTHARRRQLFDLVGAFDVDKRGEDQLRRSVDVLRRYKDQLVRAYGGEATSMPASKKCDEYIEAIRARLGETDPVPEPTGDPTKVRAVPSATPTAADRAPARNSRPLVISGGVLTGVGGALLVAGLAVYGRAYNRYDDLIKQYNDDQASVTLAQEAERWKQWENGRSASLAEVVNKFETTLLRV